MDSILSGLQSARQIVQEGKTRLTAAISNQIQSIASDPGSIIQDAIDPNGITTTTQTTIDDSIANPQPGTTVVHPQTVNVNTDIDVPGPINVAVDTSVTNEQIVTQNQDGTITLTSETTTSQGVGIEGNIGLAEGSIQGTSNTTTSTSITGSPEAIQQQAATGTLPSLDDVTSVPDGTTVTQITTEGGGVHPAAQAGAIGDDMEASIGVETTYVHESGTIESVSAESDQTTVETGTIQTQTHQIQGSAGISGNAGGIESTGQFQDLVEVENVQTQTTSANYPTTEIGDQQAQHQIDEGIVSVGEHGQVTTTTTTSTTVTENNPEFSATLDSNPAEGVSADIGQGTVNIDNEETTTHSHTVVGVSADGNTSPGQPLATENPNIDMIIEDTHTDTVEEAPHQGNAGFTSSSSHTTTYGEVPLETTQATTTDGASIDAQDNDIQQAAQQIVDGDGPLADNPIIQDVANGHSLTESINYDENSFHESFNNGHDNEPAVEAIHGLEDQLNANQGIGSLDNAHNSSMQSASNTSGSGDGSMDTSSTAASSSSSSNTPGLSWIGRSKLFF